MADSQALRTRRSRLHRRGDHSLCKPERCPDAPEPAAEGAGDAATPPEAAKRPPDSAAEPRSGGGAGEQPQEPAERVPGGIETMARAFVDSLPYADGDPRRTIGELAVALARRVDEDGAMPAAVRELRTLLMQISEVPDQPAGVVDVLRVQRAQRRVDAILANFERAGMAAVMPVPAAS